MKKICYVFGSFVILALSTLLSLWLYYNIRFQIVYISSYPFERDRWENTVTMILPTSANHYLQPAPPPAQ